MQRRLVSAAVVRLKRGVDHEGRCGWIEIGSRDQRVIQASEVFDECLRRGWIPTQPNFIGGPYEQWNVFFTPANGSSWFPLPVGPYWDYWEERVRGLGGLTDID